ncbi:hypothetical protein EUGRSUZ_E04175 [Eucalyptus grandis]|uniref:Uncharacterized protein n=2 Tax=Eucalyptus grandis TaxID=71139 RepID=A0ACC3L0H4_EUCGR|nr:hypothetical protein EUGRSUZ_E04175 [Eucalyptus grandis]
MDTVVQRPRSSSSGKKVAAAEAEFMGLQWLCTLAECTPDSTESACGTCLRWVVARLPQWTTGGRVLTSSCNVRFEEYRFYNAVALMNVTTVSATTTGVNEITNEGSLQNDLAIIKAATNNFSHQNKLAEGKFGEVFQLPNGQDIAMKKLSLSSRQDAKEFKNEVTLKSMQLDWLNRYKITWGIAHGMHHLHEDFRFKTIHRDVKASNILLDYSINLKISDFGTTRIFGVDQTHASPKKIGYMPPECARSGKFSVKSNVYKMEVLRCLHLSLLCVQEDTVDRPTVAIVCHMLSSRPVITPQP